MQFFDADELRSHAADDREISTRASPLHLRRSHHQGDLQLRAKSYLPMKRMFDLGCSGLLILVLGPAMAFIALLIKVQDGGPVLFKQQRHGLNGSRFDILKFRTMTVASSTASFRQCHEGDPRVTPLGRLLRRTSLDELPQLFNVFAGTMSLVGPRPHAIEHDFEACKALERYWLRYSVVPGMTGLAQVRGFRGSTHDPALMASRVSADLEYVERASLMLDLRILVGTIGVVVNGYNAN